MEHICTYGPHMHQHAHIRVVLSGLHVLRFYKVDTVSGKKKESPKAIVGLEKKCSFYDLQMYLRNNENKLRNL